VSSKAFFAQQYWHVNRMPACKHPSCFSLHPKLCCGQASTLFSCKATAEVAIATTLLLCWHGDLRLCWHSRGLPMAHISDAHARLVLDVAATVKDEM
jgi:hypothetical protein